VFSKFEDGRFGRKLEGASKQERIDEVTRGGEKGGGIGHDREDRTWGSLKKGEGKGLLPGTEKEQRNFGRCVVVKWTLFFTVRFKGFWCVTPLSVH